jgi:hypothetical protein
MLALLAAAACASHERIVPEARVESRLRSIVARVDAARALLATARTNPATVTAEGFSVPGARIGARASDGFEVGSIRVRRIGASDRAGRIDGGAVVFDEAGPGVDAAMFAVRGGVEDLLVLREPDAVVAYRIDVPRGHHLERREERVDVVGVDGVARVARRARRVGCRRASRARHRAH